MKTNEFKNLMGMYGLELWEGNGILFIQKDRITAATISVPHQNCFSTHFSTMAGFCEPERQEIVDLIWEYAGTDVEDRKDEKLARLRLDVPLVEHPYYLFKNKGTGKNGVSVLVPPNENLQYEFTADELLGLNRTGFKVEVVG